MRAGKGGLRVRAHIGDEDARAADMTHIRAQPDQRRLDDLQTTPRLGFHIAGSEGLAILAHRHRAGDPDMRALLHGAAIADAVLPDRAAGDALHHAYSAPLADR